MAYQKQTWNDNPGGNTPLSAARLNHMEDGIEAASLGIVVADDDPELTEPGIWVQTGLGADGSDFTFWIEDGT